MPPGPEVIKSATHLTPQPHHPRRNGQCPIRQLLRDRGLSRVEHTPKDDEGVIEAWL